VLAAGADDLQSCAAIVDDKQRLACYDALARPTVPSAPATPVADTFGLPEPKPSAEPGTLAAHIAGSLTSWQSGTTIKLDNGQVWKVFGEDSGFYRDIPENAEITITPSHFGGYVMEIKAIRRKISVRRVS
jgi:hypothetical protein